jgi:hypothetical protein
MQESPLAPWANYYVIVGSAAAALTGLLFVVVSLISRRRDLPSGDAIAAFNTPSVMHFCAALAVAALLSAPWPVLWPAALLLGLVGLWGLCYSGVVARRMRRQASYHPVLEDWAWHVVFPLAAYVALVIAALLLPGYPGALLFLVGAATVMLLFIGIHNAWDNVTYLIVGGYSQPLGDEPDAGRPTVPAEAGGATRPDGGG